MTEATALHEQAIKQDCKTLRLPTIAGQCTRLAEEAEREPQSYLGYLDALLGTELEERERHTIERRIKEALPRASASPRGPAKHAACQDARRV